MNHNCIVHLFHYSYFVLAHTWINNSLYLKELKETSDVARSNQKDLQNTHKKAKSPRLKSLDTFRG